MIIYMYLTIIIVFSILTGIITTIIEKKGLHNDTQKSVIQNVSVPSKIIRARKENSSILIPIIQPDKDLSKTLSISHDFCNEVSSVSESNYSSEPILLGIIDDEIL